MLSHDQEWNWLKVSGTQIALDQILLRLASQYT